MNYYSNYFPRSDSKVKVFISFDFDHDEDLKNLLVGQAKNEDSPFEIIDMSVKEELSGDWKEKVRQRIKRVDQVIVICGEYTDTATGVSAEVEMAQDEEKPYFVLWGRSNEECVKPKTAKEDDKIYKWTWDNLKRLLDGDRRQLANNYFIAINTVLISLIGLSFQIKIFDSSPWLKSLIPLLGIVVCIIFWFLIQSYKQLNTGKFKVIHEIEKQLPLALYKYEWEILGEGKDNTKYYPFSHIELWIPWFFGVLYLVLGLYFLLLN